MRFGRSSAAFLGLFVLVAGICYLGANRLGTVFDAKRGWSGPAEGEFQYPNGCSNTDPASCMYLFLYLSEFSAKGLNAPPLVDARGAGGEGGFDASLRRLFLPAGCVKPKGDVKAVVYYEADVGGLSFRRRFWFVRTFPYRIPLRKLGKAPVMVYEGQRFKESGLALDDGRLVAGDMEIVSVDERGTVIVKYGGREVRIDPGTGWGEARLSTGEEVSLVPSETTWKEILVEAFEAGTPFTRLSLYNYGWWDVRDIVSSGG